MIVVMYLKIRGVSDERHFNAVSVKGIYKIMEMSRLRDMSLDFKRSADIFVGPFCCVRQLY